MFNAVRLLLSRSRRKIGRPSCGADHGHPASRRRSHHEIAALLASILCAALVLSACIGVEPAFEVSQQDIPPASAHPSAHLSLEELLTAHMKFLTSDFCLGRVVNTGGATRSAQYVIDEFKSIGLSPAYRNGYADTYRIPDLTENTATLELIDGQGNTDVSSILNPAARKKCAGVLLLNTATGDKPFYPRLNTRPSGPPLTALSVTQSCYNELLRHVGETVNLTVTSRKMSWTGVNVAGVLGPGETAGGGSLCP